MMASGNPGYQVSSSAEILSQTSSSVVKMLAVGSKEPRFESLPGHELPVLSDVRQKSYAGQTAPPRGVMPAMPITGYIAMSLVSPLFQLMLQYLTQF